MSYADEYMRLGTVSIPLSNLQRERKDDAAITLHEAVKAIVDDPDRRWSDEQRLIVHLCTEALKKFNLRGSKHD
jgi:hypothetical protein